MPTHVINLAPGGSFRSTGHFATTPTDVDALVTAAASGPHPLVLHFHGGLVNEAAGLRIARSMEQLYSGLAYPVTFVWETGALETLRANLGNVWSTKLFQTLLRLVMKYAAKKLGVAADGSRSTAGTELSSAELDAMIFDGATAARIDSGARGGATSLSETDLPTLEVEIEAELEPEIEHQNDAVLLALDEAQLESPVPLSPDLQKVAPTAGARGAGLLSGVAGFFAKVVIAVVRRYIRTQDHGFYPTVVEEILRAAYLADLGAWSWSGIKRSASSMWGPNGGGKYFLDRLAALPAPPTIDLVGHSAGSIAICHMIEALAQRNPVLPIRNVTLLAPACRHDVFLATVVPALQANLIRSLRIFTMSDEAERRDPLIDKVPFLYPSSLLYLVSGALEDKPDAPILGMQRFLSGAPPFSGGGFDVLRGVLSAGRIVLSPTDAAAALGLRCKAIDHGTFDEDGPTRESLTTIVKS